MARKRRKRGPRRDDARTQRKARGEDSRSGESGTEAARRAAEARGARDRAKDPNAPAEPVFWFGFEVAWAKLLLGRIVVFGMLAIDAVLQIRHAPRYGAGGFNVAHVSWFDALAPGRAAFAIAELVEAYLFVLIACGVATRRLLPIATAIYAWVYFSSQLDSYQHHYLVALLLLLFCFVPWQRHAANATPATAVRAWALRLALVQLAIMYIWAAISKLDHAWLDGSTLGGQLSGAMRRAVDATVGIRVVAIGVIVTEVVLAATVWLRPAWRVAAPLGILFHLGIAFSGLEIGMFAWLMVAFYIFIVPDVVWVSLAATAPMRFVRDRLGALSAWSSANSETRSGLGALGVALVAGVAVALLCRLEWVIAVAVVAAIVIAVTVLAAGFAGKRNDVAAIALAHLLAIATWVSVDRATNVAYDYYRYLGTAERKFGDHAIAERAYRHVVDIAPDEVAGHLGLGRLLLDRGDEAGLAELHEAARLDPKHGRAQVYEARWLVAHDRRDQAITKAREATAADPSDTDAQTLLSRLVAGKAPAPAHDDVD